MASTLTRAQRAVAAALLFLMAAGIVGIAPGEQGVHYAVFGAVEGILSLLLAAALLGRGVWMRPVDALGWTAVIYGTVALAQVLEFLLPPPGVLEWVVVIGLLFSSWGLVGAGDRRRVVHSLAAAAVLLALVRYSVLPLLWTIGPERGAALGLGNLAESVRVSIAQPRSSGAAAQLLGVLGIALWAAATRLLWPSESTPSDPAQPIDSAPGTV